MIYRTSALIRHLVKPVLRITAAWNLYKRVINDGEVGWRGFKGKLGRVKVMGEGVHVFHEKTWTFIPFPSQTSSLPSSPCPR